MKKAGLTHILTPALLIICLFSCNGRGQYSTLLERADSFMANHPDSAYALLTSVDSVGLHSQRKSVCMRYELLRAEAQNKLLIPFTTDSVLREIVRYYDRHGSSNQQLKARNLLGCAYRDLHEAPNALLTWEDAIAAADTTAADCDYATLFRVYGQMNVASPYITKKEESLGTSSRAATQEEWAGMKEVLMSAHPQFFLFLQKHKLSNLKTKVCILSYLGFDNTEIATLTGANPGSITNARTAIARDLFNLSSARDLNRCLIELESPA